MGAVISRIRFWAAKELTAQPVYSERRHQRRQENGLDDLPPGFPRSMLKYGAPVLMRVTAWIISIASSGRGGSFPSILKRPSAPVSKSPGF